MLSFKELIVNKHKVLYVELSNKTEEEELHKIMKTLKGLNSVINKPIPKDKSAEYEYYIGVCYEKRKQHKTAKAIFYNSAQKGCSTSWLALGQLCSWSKELRCKLNAYEQGNSYAIDYMNENNGEFITSMYMMAVKGESEYLLWCVRLCNKYKNSDIFSLLGNKRIKARQEDIQELKSLLVEIEGWLEEPKETSDYVMTVINPEKFTAQDVSPYAERECKRVSSKWW